jgi:tetratricopeptide (TPR) repeat protein
MHFARTLDDAEGLWRKGIEVTPEDDQVPIMVGMIYRKQGRIAERDATLRRGVAIARKHLEAIPDDARAMYLIAGALWDLGEEAESRAFMEKALAKLPSDATLQGDASRARLPHERSSPRRRPRGRL